jgi:hypothetical protein
LGYPVDWVAFPFLGLGVFSCVFLEGKRRPRKTINLN